MGLFDSMYVDCLACGAANEMQSKGAEYPYLNRYTPDTVPADVASDLDTEFTCEACGMVHAVDIDISRRRFADPVVRVAVRLAHHHAPEDAV